jgi:hypothetical protein
VLPIVQALPDAEVRMGGGDDVDPDPNVGREHSAMLDLAPQERARLSEALWRNDFFRDCLAQAQLVLKVHPLPKTVSWQNVGKGMQKWSLATHGNCTLRRAIP